ncbi:MAG: HlyD family efflux transporter periplasmic adaptor subunit [Actinomycetota bacterium]
MIPARRALLVVAVAASLGACVAAPTPERSGVGAPVEVDTTIDPDSWGRVGDDTATDRALVAGVVVVRTTRSITAPVTGRVTDVAIRRGDAVESGEVLVTMRPTSPALDELERAILALDAALAERPTPDVIGDLLDARDAAAARVAAEVGGSSPRLLTVEAPATGAVSSVSATVGARVEGGAELATMGETSEVEVHATVPTPLLGPIEAGSGDALVIERGDVGEVTPARLAPPTERVVRTEDDGATSIVRFLFDEVPALVDGNRVDVEVDVDVGTATVSVPVDALRDDGTTFVLADDDGELVRVDVEVRLVGDAVAEVEGELRAGQLVLLR